MRPNANMFCATTLMTIALTTPSVHITGKGPPVLFQTGIYNTLPRFFYSRFLKEMEKSTSIITTRENLNDLSTIDRIADSLGAESIGLITHSGMNPSLLESSRVERSVLIDPISIPDLTLFEGVQASKAIALSPTCIIRSGWTLDAIPESFRLDVDGAQESSNEAGPVDILDNIYGGVADNMGLRYIRQTNPETRSFSNWSATSSTKVTQTRNDYRHDIVKQCLDFLLDRSSALTTITVEDGPD